MTGLLAPGQEVGPFIIIVSDEANTGRVAVRCKQCSRVSLLSPRTLLEKRCVSQTRCSKCPREAVRTTWAKRSELEQALKERDEARAELKLVREGCDGWLEKCEQVSKERNEARADHDYAQQALDKMNDIIARVSQERDEAAAQLARLCGISCLWEGAAYRRGAEAMREACAAALMNMPVDAHRTECADGVRALPIPEDKP